MKNHVKIYLKENGYDPCDTIVCEIPDCNEIAVDIHHIDARGMGGSKTKDVNENLVALCREDHAKAEARNIPKEFLLQITKERIHARHGS